MTRPGGATRAVLALLAAATALPGCPKDEVSLGDDTFTGQDGGPGAGGSGAGGSGGAPPAGTGGAGKGGSGGAGGHGGRGFPPPGGFPPAGAACGSRGLPNCPPVQFCVYDEADQCGDSDQAGHCEWLPLTNCTTEVDPVCGCDGTSYDNECIAAALGVSVRHGGRCNNSSSSGMACGGPFRCGQGEYCRFGRESQCGGPSMPGVCTRIPGNCSREARPVCGCDGMSYPNECFAAMNGVSVRYGGECDDGSSGSGGSGSMDGGMPARVCGGEQATTCRNGEFCDLAAGDGCDGVNKPRGECHPRPTACSSDYDPVCGCDGETYPNACFAAGFSASIDHDGECQ